MTRIEKFQVVMLSWLSAVAIFSLTTLLLAYPYAPHIETIPSVCVHHINGLNVPIKC